MNRTKQLTETKERLIEIVERHEKLRNAYFWTPAANASGRRYNEKRNNDSYVSEILPITAENHYSESCKHVYYSGVFYVDGKKTTVTKIKNIIYALEVVC